MVASGLLVEENALTQIFRRTDILSWVLDVVQFGLVELLFRGSCARLVCVAVVYPGELRIKVLSGGFVLRGTLLSDVFVWTLV